MGTQYPYYVLIPKSYSMLTCSHGSVDLKAVYAKGLVSTLRNAGVDGSISMTDSTPPGRSNLKASLKIA